MSSKPTLQITPPPKTTWALTYLRHAPFSLCLRELNRLYALFVLFQKKVIPESVRVLDVGCGDGFWWKLAKDKFPSLVPFGIDISEKEVNQAKHYFDARVADISQANPFPGQTFDWIIGNCSLEHIANIHGALENITALANSSSTLVLFVPAPKWAYQGFLQNFLLKHFPRLSMSISGALNGFFQHWHVYEPEVWNSLLMRHGWVIEESFGLGNSQSEFLFRLFLPTSFFAFLFKTVLGFYPNRLLQYVPDFFLDLPVQILGNALKQPLCPIQDPKAYEYVLIARKS